MASLAPAATVIVLDFVVPGLGITLSEIRMKTDDSVLEVKRNLSMRTGIEPSSMKLTTAENGTVLEDGRELAELGLENGAIINVEDLNSEGLGNVLFQQQEQPVAAPNVSSDAGFAAFRQAKKKTAAPANDDTDRDAAAKFQVGDRVTTQSGASATVRFIGPVEPLPKGFWVGMELDEPTGKNDGGVKGCRLFGPVEPNKGAVARPSSLKKLVPEGDQDEL